MNYRVLALSGSPRAGSSNEKIIHALAAASAGRLQVTVYDGLARLPHFNPDEDRAGTPPEVARFRAALRAADGILICTPEYAHGVPGTLKNAIDWTVGSGEFSGRPTALITASTDGRFGHQALLETLKVIEAGSVEELNLLISFVRTRVDGAGNITDAATQAALERLAGGLLRAIETAAGPGTGAPPA
ncbi:MAG: NAD(P)H-dependent oxidoreductase [Chitinophagaceae bacterium]|nr:MAG: NAD(P)H-dependent oxidoreductase [Chitinophagaceae bacterium]